MLLDLIIKKQKEEGLNNSQFSLKIGVVPQLYGMNKKSGKLGQTVINAFGRTYPEYGREILKHQGIIERPRFSFWGWLR